MLCLEQHVDEPQREDGSAGQVRDLRGLELCRTTRGEIETKQKDWERTGLFPVQLVYEMQRLAADTVHTEKSFLVGRGAAIAIGWLSLHVCLYDEVNSRLAAVRFELRHCELHRDLVAARGGFAGQWHNLAWRAGGAVEGPVPEVCV